MDNEPDTNPETTPEGAPDMEPEQQQAGPQPHMTRRERRNRKRFMLLVGGGGILVLALVGWLSWTFLAGGNKKAPAQQPASNEQQSAEEIPPPTQADPTPVVYKSAKNNIELTHRKDWTLKEADDGEITITSPRTSYTKFGGQSTTGVFTFKFRIGVPDRMKTTIEKAVAARDSEVIAYDDPPETQRYYTNLSYAGQKDVFNFFIVTGNTALKAGNAFAYTLVLDGEFYMLVGGFGSDEDGTLSFDAVPPSMINSEVAQQAIAIVKSLKIF